MPAGQAGWRNIKNLCGSITTVKESFHFQPLCDLVLKSFTLKLHSTKTRVHQKFLGNGLALLVKKVEKYGVNQMKPFFCCRFSGGLHSANMWPWCPHGTPQTGLTAELSAPTGAVNDMSGEAAWGGGRTPPLGSLAKSLRVNFNVPLKLHPLVSSEKQLLQEHTAFGQRWSRSFKGCT